MIVSVSILVQNRINTFLILIKTGKYPAVNNISVEILF